MTHDFIHIGDLHLDERSPRNADRLASLDQIVRESLARPDLAAWLIPGDLFHARSTAGDRNALDARLMQMADRAPVVIVYGNHDAPGDLDGFANLRAAYPISVVDRPHVLSVRLATGAMASIACLPYPRKAGLIAAGTTAAETLDAGREALAAIVQGLALELDAARERGEITLSIGHVNVGGSIASMGQPQIGREVELDPASVQALGACGYVGLNHIHKPQVIHGAFYAGSVAPMDFGEAEQKVYVVATYGPHGWGGNAGDGPWASAGPALDYDITHRPLAVPPMLFVEGELTREGFAWSWTSKEGVVPPDGPIRATVPDVFKGADIRVRITYRPAEQDALDWDLVKAPFAGARILKVEPVPILDQAIRAPEVVAAVTVDAQVRAYCAEQGIAVTEGLLAKLDALRAPDAENGALLLEVAS